MRIFTQTFFLSWFVCLFSLTTFAEQAEPRKNFRIEQFSVHDGLSQNSVSGIVKDTDGFLWIATGSGLNRYDGHHFQVIQGPDGVFVDKYISMLTQTSDGVLWVAIPNSGIFSLTPGDSQFIKRVEEALTDEWWFTEITNIFLHQGAYYFISDNALHRLDSNTNNTEQLYQIEQQSEAYYDILRHAYPEQEFIFLATSTGLQAYNLKTSQVSDIDYLNGEAGNINQSNTKYLLPHDGELMIATVEGLYALNIDELVHSLREGTQMPTARIRDANLNIWQIVPHQTYLFLATQTGLYELHNDAAEPKLNLRFSDSDLPAFDNSIHHLSVDNDDNLWLGTRFNGLFQFRPEIRHFTSIAQGIGEYPELSNNQVWALAEDSQQRLWVGTQNGLNMLDWADSKQHDVFFEVAEDSAYYHEGVIYNIYPDPNEADIIWLYKADYMYKFRVSTGELTPLADLMDNEEDRQRVAEGFFWSYKLVGEQLWFADAGAIFSFNIRSRNLRTYTEFNHPEFDLMNLYSFIGFHPNNAEQLLLGLASEVWAYNIHSGETERLYRQEPYHRYAEIYVESMVEDTHNRLWMSLIGVGLLIFDADSMQLLDLLSIAEGLPTRALYQGHLDANGYLWFSSMTGLLRINPNTYHVERFSYREGVSSNEFNYNASTSLSDGRLAFGSMRGLTLFDPLQLEPDQRQLLTRISAINDISTGERLPLPLQDLTGATLSLPHDNRGIRIEVSNSSLDRPGDVRYNYNLTGPESLSIAKSRETSISFPRLRPGDYRLQVVAIDPRTGHLATPAFVDITVAYHPLRSPLAFLIYALLLFIFLATLSRYRFQQHRRLMRSKQRVELSEERLSLAVKATQSGIWDWHRQGDRVFTTRLQDELGHHSLGTEFAMNVHQRYIHHRDLPHVSQQWQALLKGECEDFNCTYRMRHKNGHWFWYHDIGQVSRRNSNGEPERVTGVFQNITNVRSIEDKALLFGQVFAQTQDWVLVLDSEQRPLTANQAFYEAAGLDETTLTKFAISNLSQQRLSFYRNILRGLQPGEQWRGEDVLSLVNQPMVPVFINISAVADRANNHAYIIVLTDISAQKEAEAQLLKMANYDALTNLPNRALLNQKLDAVLQQQPAVEPTQIALMFIDLDRFKQVNDSHGHSIGDTLLCMIAKRIQGCLRSTDTVARLGGDEFIILLQEANENGVRETAERVLQAVNQPLNIEHHHLRISPSIGIALYPQHGLSREELLKHADIAMYDAKDSGRNCYRMFHPDMDARIRARLDLEVKLKQAVSLGALKNAYQPIIDGHSNECIGIELLLRWPMDDKHIAPDVFIPLAEDLGLIVPITEQAMYTALQDLQQMRMLQPNLYLSVNLSVRHLDYESLPQQVAALLQEFGLPPSALRFELTEGILIKETLRARAILHELCALGIQIMLDDFGTGYSSLRYLKDFPIDVIKIDRGFTADIEQDSSDDTIIETILAMASNMDKVCIAEGVETEMQRRWLLARGCHLMQGYLFSPAQPAEALLNWLDNHKKTLSP